MYRIGGTIQRKRTKRMNDSLHRQRQSRHRNRGRDRDRQTVGKGNPRCISMWGRSLSQRFWRFSTFSNGLDTGFGIFLKAVNCLWGFRPCIAEITGTFAFLADARIDWPPSAPTTAPSRRQLDKMLSTSSLDSGGVAAPRGTVRDAAMATHRRSLAEGGFPY